MHSILRLEICTQNTVIRHLLFSKLRETIYGVRCCIRLETFIAFLKVSSLMPVCHLYRISKTDFVVQYNTVR